MGTPDIEIEDVISRLDEFVKLDSSEISDVYVHMSVVYAYSDYISEELRKQLEEEFIGMLYYYEENWEIKEVEETIPEETVVRKELVQKF